MQENKALYEELFLRLVATRSDTNSVYERIIEEIILSFIKSIEYFKKNPELAGTKPIEDDPYNREVVWALLKGQGNNTIVMVHHHDAVDIEDYGKLKHKAFRPDELQLAFSNRKISHSVRKDIESGDWIFGRGTADMKGGAAIQLGLLKEFAEKENFSGNLLLLSVPDEETLSKGMLYATELMYELAQMHGLNYILTINSEPYFNNTKNKALMYEGSVGKILPIIYIKGVKSHIGDPYNGINPSLILAYIQTLSELNVDLCDKIGDEATPPPIWVNLKDRKKAYDASIPDAATGYFNWLTFTKSPVEILNQLKGMCHKALHETMHQFEKSYLDFCKLTDEEPDIVSFEPRVMDFSELYQEAMGFGGEKFLYAYEKFQRKVYEKLSENEITLPEAGIRLVEFTADFMDLEGPTVVVAISGPYYPHVSNCLIPGGERFKLHERVNRISKELYNVEYKSNAYFMGISDLSYASWTGNEKDIQAINNNSPGWDTIYHIPFEAIQSFQMPVVNIGPWGKDLHKPTERVLAKDVYERIPAILRQLVCEVFAQENNIIPETKYS
ncbi:MAG: M20/M25/M40 family metallo-hydrolase [Candidatus Rifleibacteriota bacterium]